MKKELKPCPFCGAIPNYFDSGDYKIFHADYCYFYTGESSIWIFESYVKAWEMRK